MSWKLFAASALACLVLAPHALAQVRCTMPNGTVIEQRFSDRCPQGALKSETLDGQPAEAREAAVALPSVARQDAKGLWVQDISGAQLGAAWPLTVDAGELRCVSTGESAKAALFVHEGAVYALNGVAKSGAEKSGWRDIDSIWRADPAGGGLKVSIAPLIERALALCSPASKAAPKPVQAAVKSGAAPAADEGMSFGAWLVVTLLAFGLFAGIKATTGSSGDVLYCTSCGNEGKTKIRTKGSLVIEVILWLLMIFPGLIYSVWRHASRDRVCSSCGAATLIHPNSPAARKMKRSLE